MYFIFYYSIKQNDADISSLVTSYFHLVVLFFKNITVIYHLFLYIYNHPCITIQRTKNKQKKDNEEEDDRKTAD
jgi:hypothetical protein